jgi:hypothetical protein
MNSDIKIFHHKFTGEIPIILIDDAAEIYKIFNASQLGSMVPSESNRLANVMYTLKFEQTKVEFIVINKGLMMTLFGSTKQSLIDGFLALHMGYKTQDNDKAAYNHAIQLLSTNECDEALDSVIQQYKLMFGKYPDYMGTVANENSKEDIEQELFTEAKQSVPDSLVAIRSDLTKKHADKIKNVYSKEKGFGKFNKGIHHLRFDIPGDDKAVKKFFKSLDYIAEPTDAVKLSGKYQTYILKHKTLGNAYMVNRSGSKMNSRILDKSLTPDMLGLAGQTLTSSGIIKTVSGNVENLKIDDSTKKTLIDLLHASDTKSNRVAFDVGDLNDKELAMISKDYGEICAAIWAIKSQGYDKAHFPSSSNAPLVDFNGLEKKLIYPISVKSGEGSAVSIGNLTDMIMDTIEDPTKLKNFTAKEKELAHIIADFTRLSVVEGFLNAHKLLKTKAIKTLSKLTKIPIKEINEQSMTKWIVKKLGKDNFVFEKELKSFYKDAGTGVSKGSWKKFYAGTLPKYAGIFIAPLNASMAKLLNENKTLREFITKIAQQVSILQLNIDVKTGTLQFEIESFSKFEFEFKWSGSVPNPVLSKLGFKAVKKK